MTAARIRSWSLPEYHRLIELGILTSADQVQLINGQLVEMSPQNSPHASTVQRATEYLRSLVWQQASVRSQLPVSLPPNSEPEPDIAIVQINENEYVDHHPRAEDMLLIVEVADTSLDFDTNEKAQLYAKAGVGDYWVIDINSGVVYIARDPKDGNYQQFFSLNHSDTVELLMMPGITVHIAQLFPAPLRRQAPS